MVRSRARARVNNVWHVLVILLRASGNHFELHSTTVVANGMHPSRLYHCCPIGACIFPDLRHGFVHRPPDFPLVKVWSRDYGLGERERGNSAIARRGIVSYGGSEPPPPPVAKWFSKELNAIYQVTRFSSASGDLSRLPLVNLARSFSDCRCSTF